MTFAVGFMYTAIVGEVDSSTAHTRGRVYIAMFVSIGLVFVGMFLFFFVKEDLKRTKAEKKKSFVRESVAIKSRSASKAY